ncbi:hypothetical protein VD0004_g2602 [Verticillium dahliae]|uniref:Glutamine amidotransferase type-2 domain-containing protein n=1 Tax=Verticillium dahliae TaxID=27337 RepID=A0A444RN67_VERDA|nr:hypothetical protein VD0004_g2602 [Verticillium dahliae]PNH75377.1 hypothetical protein VD0001_g2168 [Verticillium dahliae]RXG42567.1 hypothetical protein VDGE_03525 [Verticillium dahliae]
MCGIHASVTRGVERARVSDDLTRCLACRGPDHLGNFQETVQLEGSAPITLSFTSTVLALRGDHVTPQPFRDDVGGSVFCWNGEAWRVDGGALDGNDGELIFARLEGARATASSSEEAVLGVLRAIEGPFAFLFFDRASSKVYYGRDRLGRRSLLQRQDAGLVLASVVGDTDPSWSEVEADGIYVFDLQSWAEGRDVAGSVSRYPWLGSSEKDLVLDIGVFNTALPDGEPAPLVPESAAVQMLRQQLRDSLALRVLDIPNPPHSGTELAITDDARVSVLFSGGLDCTVLARLASDLLPPDQGIDLLNVAFENPRVAGTRRKDATKSIYEICPDRVTGRKSFAELVRVCPARRWRFVAVNVPYTETLAHRSQVVSLMYPHRTEMDISISFALYFAARGVGEAQAMPSSEPVPYATPARVLLSGLGADELFGGYSRHAVAFERGGYQALVDELKLDVGRLGERNLGRDDRIMAHWGREVRFPFLDERLVKWAVETPAWGKCDFNHPQTETMVEPAKRVLRLLAEELGMRSVAREKKRAIQFGAKTAKMVSGQSKGTDLILEFAS